MSSAVFLRSQKYPKLYVWGSAAKKILSRSFNRPPLVLFTIYTREKMCDHIIID